MIWKTLIAISVAAILIGGWVWVDHGSHFITKDREKVVTIVEDELFGTTHEEVEWVETFDFGLVPDSTHPMHAYRSYLFVLGISAVVIIVSFVMLRRQKRSQ